MIPGLLITRGFVNEDEQDDLIHSFGVSTVAPGDKRNRILRYGPGVLATGYVDGDLVQEIPAELDDLCTRLVIFGLVDARPNAVTVNEYHPGQGLTFHTDNDRSGDVICILGLGSACELVFRNVRGKEQRLAFPARALVRMTGECRKHPWKHSVPPVPELRYSVVFRHGKIG